MSRIGQSAVRRLCAYLVLTLVSFVLQAEAQKISAAEASKHIGEQATVCGSVASAKFATRSNGTPTFLNLERPYPDRIFTALIWGEDRPKFGRPEDAYLGQRVCVTGEE